MKLLYIVNGLGFATNVSLGGSDKRAMEIGARLQKVGHEIFVLTTPVGHQLLQDNLTVTYFVIKEPFFLRGNIKNTVLGRFMAYCYLGFTTCFYPFKERFDVVFPTSDFFFDVVPAISCKVRRISKKMISIIHHVILEPLKRKGGIFKNLSLYFLQRMSFVFIAVFSDKVFVYATKEGKKIKEILGRSFKVADTHIASVVCGIDLKKMEKVTLQDKEYVACFIGGLRPVKGLNDFVPIWKAVVEHDKSAKLLIVGGGVSNYIEHLSAQIRDAGLENNVILMIGHLEEGRLYEMMGSAKLLILPSYEEGWSIIICEALSLGLPAVVYDLEVFEIFADAVFRVRLGDTKAFAKAILDIMNDDVLCEKARKNALSVSKRFDWDKAALIEEQLLSAVIAEDK